MRRLALAALVALAAAALRAERQVGFGVESFFAANPTGRVASAVISPIALELDCAAVSELYPPIRRAAIAEAIGVMTGWESVYRPILARYGDAATNGLSLVSARAVLVPHHRFVDSAFRVAMQRDWGVEVCPMKFGPEGAECWLRAAMDGRMEDFALRPEERSKTAVSFRELTDVRCAWECPLAEGPDVRMEFAAPGGRRAIPALRGVLEGAILEKKAFTLLRLPMADGAAFYALLPAAGATVDSLRAELKRDLVPVLILSVDSLTELGVFRGPVEVSIPRFETVTDTDLLPVFAHFSLPLDGGFATVAVEGRLSGFRQRARLRLDGRGAASAPDEGSGRSGARPRAFALDRPFLYFIYHAPTRTMPALGVYAGD